MKSLELTYFMKSHFEIVYRNIWLFDETVYYFSVLYYSIYVYYFSVL